MASLNFFIVLLSLQKTTKVWSKLQGSTTSFARNVSWGEKTNKQSSECLGNKTTVVKISGCKYLDFLLLSERTSPSSTYNKKRNKICMKSVMYSFVPTTWLPHPPTHLMHGTTCSHWLELLPTSVPSWQRSLTGKKRDLFQQGITHPFSSSFTHPISVLLLVKHNNVIKYEVNC